MNATQRAMAAARTVTPIKPGGHVPPGAISAGEAAAAAGVHRSVITDCLALLKHGTVEEVMRAQNGSGLSAAAARIRANSRTNDGSPEPIPSVLIDVDPSTRQASAWVGTTRVFSMTALCHSVEQVARRLIHDGFPDGLATIRYGDLLSQDPRPLSHLARGQNRQVAA